MADYSGKSNMSEKSLISVILATYNWPKALVLCLQSLADQTDKVFEIVIADDGSGAETQAVIEQFQKLMLQPIRHEWHEDKGFRKSIILNKAIQSANGDYLIFLDGDCIVQPDFIAKHRALSQPGMMVTGSRILLEKELTTQLCQSGQWNYLQFKKDVLHYRLNGQINKVLALWLKWISMPYRIYSKFVWRRIKGCNMAAWRDDVLRINGFDEQLVGWGHEDADFVFRLHQSGILRKSGSWATEVLHLWHPSQSKENAEKNAAIVRARILEKANTAI
jgi:glycosyltransferase involved in cell wall biosynthesis